MPRPNTNLRKRNTTATDKFVSLAKDAYESSTSYVDQNYRKVWDNAIRAFHNEHPQGSKYYHPTYKFRSKLYRPKTRGTIRRVEAAGAAAFFGNLDLVKVDADNENDERQVMSAKIHHWLLNYRLEKSIPWFQTCIGGLQDAAAVGVVASYNYWDFRKRATDGKIIADKPVVDLRPIENLRIDPSANWLAPINSSPYLIDLIPMYIGDVLDMMHTIDDKTGAPKWKHYKDAEIISSQKYDYDTTRQARHGKRQDPHEVRDRLNAFEIVWVHRNIMKQHGEDMIWYTLGTELLLSEPKYLDEVYFHGDRPYTMGSYMLETHKIYPAGLPELSKDLQKEANEIANSRLDNVKLVLNKRYFVKRGREVDLSSLVRNAAGSATLMTDPKEDVVVVDTPDVTGSSYAEQDRINLDFDELVGSFSPGSVQSNRQLNETVGGLQLLKGDSGTMTGYGLKTFVETWMQPTLRQVVKLEAKYETDITIFSLAAEKADAFQRYGVNTDMDKLLDQELTVTVNVGMTATDPGTRLQQLILVTQAFTQIAANNTGLDLKTLADEMYGKIGYRDSEKFWPGEEPPEVVQLKQGISQLKAELEGKTREKQVEGQIKYALEQMKVEGENRRTSADIEFKKEAENNKRYIAELDARTKFMIARLNKNAEAAKSVLEAKRGEQLALTDQVRREEDIDRQDRDKAEAKENEGKEKAVTEENNQAVEAVQSSLTEIKQELEEGDEERERIQSIILEELKKRDPKLAKKLKKAKK